MEIKKFIIRFIFIKSCLCSAIYIFPDQSMSCINGNLVIFRSSISTSENSLISYPFNNSYIYDVQALIGKPNYTKVQNDFIDQYDYKFFNPSGKPPYRKPAYILGSIKQKNLKSSNDDISRRFSLMKIKKGVAIKEQWPSMPAPLGFSEFPDIEYESAFIGEVDFGMHKPKALLYIMGGSKYIVSKNSLEMIKHFTLFNFTSQTWEDLSGTLPKELSHIAGHQLININDEKLIALGGYRTNNYTMEPRVAAVNPSFNTLKNIFLYDIKEKKWESKQTLMTEQDEKVLSCRKHYSITAKYQYNKLYVYAGFESGLKNATSHYFGILDLDSWDWKWYQIGFDSDIKDITNTSFDSILVSDAMIVSHSECYYNTDVKFFKFDLNLGYYSNLGKLSYQRLDSSNDSSNDSAVPKTKIVPTALTVFLVVMAIIITSSILFFLYRYYRKSKQPKEDGIRFETEVIWSDPSIYTTQNNNITNEHLRRYRLYQYITFQQLNSYTPLGQTLSYYEPELASIHESNSRTHVDVSQALYKLSNTSENSDIYKTY
jgi:uncharacterized protein YlzI (FlbEa/FlbD family)